MLLHRGYQEANRCDHHLGLRLLAIRLVTAATWTASPSLTERDPETPESVT